MSQPGLLGDSSPEASPKTTRKRFLDLAIAGTGAALAGSIVYPITRFLTVVPTGDATSLRVKVGRPEDVAPGTAVAFRFGSKPGILVRDTGGKLRAFIAICTHLSCVVQFREDMEMIWCACHNGHFDLTGRNIKGPPPRPLDPLAVEVKDGDVFVTNA